MNKLAMLKAAISDSDRPHWKNVNDKIRVRSKFVMPNDWADIVWSSSEMALTRFSHFPGSKCPSPYYLGDVKEQGGRFGGGMPSQVEMFPLIW